MKISQKWNQFVTACSDVLLDQLKVKPTDNRYVGLEKAARATCVAAAIQILSFSASSALIQASRPCLLEAGRLASKGVVMMNDTTDQVFDCFATKSPQLNVSNEYINAAFPKDSPMRLLFKSSTVVLLGAGIVHLPKTPDRVSPAAPDTRCENI